MALLVSNKKINLAGYKVPLLYVAGVTLAIGIGGYYFLIKKKQPDIQAGQGQGQGMPPLVAVAPDVIFALNPQQIMPPQPFVIMGQFQTQQGMPVTVRQGYYYVFITDASRNKRLVSQGSVGVMVSRFTVPVQTTGWQSGNYSVVVTDEIMTPQQMQSQGIQTGTPPQSQIQGGTYNQATLPQPPLPTPTPAQPLNSYG